jgi:hypothetical protein
MSETSGREVQTLPVASFTEPNCDHEHDDDDAYADKDGPAIVMTKEENTSVTDQIVSLEKGSLPSHAPHVIKDGGLIAWSTTLGACVESARRIPIADDELVSA